LLPSHATRRLIQPGQAIESRIWEIKDGSTPRVWGVIRLLKGTSDATGPLRHVTPAPSDWIRHPKRNNTVAAGSGSGVGGNRPVCWVFGDVQRRSLPCYSRMRFAGRPCSQDVRKRKRIIGRTSNLKTRIFPRFAAQKLSFQNLVYTLFKNRGHTTSKSPNSRKG
jgi:hypothetical protein